MLSVLLVEDNDNLRAALAVGLAATGAVRVCGDCASGEAALAAWRRVAAEIGTRQVPPAPVTSARRGTGRVRASGPG